MEKTKIVGSGQTAGNRTDRKYAVTSLHFRVLEKINTPVVYIGRDCCYKFVNRAYAEWYGADEAHITGAKVESFLGTKAFAFLKPYIDDALNGNTVHYEEEVPFRDSTRFIEATYTPDFDKNGNVKGFVALINDATAQKKAEKELINSRKYFESMLTALPVAVYTCDKDGRITFFNDVAVKLWGYTPDTADESIRFCACYKVWLEDGTFIAPDKTPMAIALKTGLSYRNLELVVERPDGSRFHVIVNIDPLFDKEGEIYGAVNIFQDISNYKVAETALRESEQKYRDLVQGLSAAIYTTDKNGYITLYNDAAAEVWGRHPELGKEKWCGSSKIFRSDGVTPIAHEECPMAVALTERRRVTGEEIIIERPDGSRKYILPHPQPLFDSAGNVTGAVNMLLDITERKMAEESRARLAAIVWFSEDAIISKTTQGIITSWNPAAEKLYGFTEKEMIGRPMSMLIPEEFANEEPGILERINLGERIEPFETRRITKSGRLIDVSLSVSPIKDASGNVIGASNIARDISRQKEDRRRIFENEERLRMAVESTNLGTWEYLPVSGKLSWSNECRRIFDVPEDTEVDFNFFTDHIYHEDKPYVEKEIQHAMDPGGDGNYDIQYRIVRYSDGQPRWIRAQGKVYFHAGHPERFIGTVLDISKEKLQNEQLIGSVELFQTMADNVPAMIWMSGTDKFKEYFNRTWLGFTGRTEDQERSTGWLTNVHPEDVNKCTSTYDDAFSVRKGFYVEYRLRRYDGEYRWVANNSTPRFSPDGAFLGFITACIDIDDQKRFREKIQDSELMFKTISSTSPAALWMTDREKNTVFVNDTWLKWSKGEFTTQLRSGWVNTLLPEDRQKVVEHFNECFDERKKFVKEFRIQDTDGSLRWCLTEGKPYFDINGMFAGYAGSVTDITEMKKLEQRKDDFIKMASHELKTPITSIHGYVQLLQNICSESDPGKIEMATLTIRSSLGTISKQVAKLSRLVSELLDLSKIDSGKLELQCSEFYFEELVEETVQDIRYTAARHAVILENNFQGKVYGDKDRIGQVLINILNNAIKYSPGAGQVEVHVEGDANSVAVRIKDYGIGIDKKDHRRIFERFYRVEGKREQTFPGFGIGLFIADEVIRRHRGSIHVKSEKGRGAVFTVHLPIDFRK